MLPNIKVDKYQLVDRNKRKLVNKVNSKEFLHKNCHMQVRQSSIIGSRAMLRFFGGGGYGKLGDVILVHHYAHQLATQILLIPKKREQEVSNYANFCND